VTWAICPHTRLTLTPLHERSEDSLSSTRVTRAFQTTGTAPPRHSSEKSPDLSAEAPQSHFVEQVFLSGIFPLSQRSLTECRRRVLKAYRLVSAKGLWRRRLRRTTIFPGKGGKFHHAIGPNAIRSPMGEAFGPPWLSSRLRLGPSSPVYGLTRSIKRGPRCC
jgi:hypothetical protein